MKTPVDEFASILERLTEKVEELEARLSALEHRSAAMGHPVVRPASPATLPPSPLDSLSIPWQSGGLATVGRVFLGMAGAYLLRALAESGVLPQLAVVAVALAYAVAWLVWAAHARAAPGFARVASAITAALILSPMVWELTMRFQILPARVTAAVLAGFVVLASALAWKRNLAAIVGVATLSAAVTGLVLLVATRDPAPFALALLVMALAAEVAACRDRWLGLRPLAALASNCAALALILIYTPQQGMSAEYKPLSSPVLLVLVAALFVIYATSTVFRTVGLRRRISVFEIAQPVMAFVLATEGVLRISSAAAPVLGAFCLVAAAGSYLAAFIGSARPPQSRNYHVFTTWAAALFLTGSFLLVPEALRGTWLAVGALVAVFLGVRSARMTISFHGAMYLAAAAFASGLLESAGHVLVGDLPLSSSGAVWLTAGATLLCYAIAARRFSDPDPWSQRLLRLVLAALAAYVVVAVGVLLIASLASLATAVSGRLLAVIRTLAVCLAALALAFVGSRWKRIELVWLAYTAIAFCTLKLLFEDLRIGSAGSIAASLFCYGMAWVLVPRLARKSPASAQARIR